MQAFLASLGDEALLTCDSCTECFLARYLTAQTGRQVYARTISAYVDDSLGFEEVPLQAWVSDAIRRFEDGPQEYRTAKESADIIAALTGSLELCAV